MLNRTLRDKAAQLRLASRYTSNFCPKPAIQKINPEGRKMADCVEKVGFSPKLANFAVLKMHKMLI